MVIKGKFFGKIILLIVLFLFFVSIKWVLQIVIVKVTSLMFQFKYPKSSTFCPHFYMFVCLSVCLFVCLLVKYGHGKPMEGGLKFLWSYRCDVSERNSRWKQEIRKKGWMDGPLNIHHPQTWDVRTKYSSIVRIEKLRLVACLLANKMFILKCIPCQITQT